MKTIIIVLLILMPFTCLALSRREVYSKYCHVDKEDMPKVFRQASRNEIKNACLEGQEIIDWREGRSEGFIEEMEYSEEVTKLRQEYNYSTWLDL